MQGKFYKISINTYVTNQKAIASYKVSHRQTMLLVGAELVSTTKVQPHL